MFFLRKALSVAFWMANNFSYFCKFLVWSYFLYFTFMVIWFFPQQYWEAGGHCNTAIAAARLGLRCLAIGHVVVKYMVVFFWMCYMMSESVLSRWLMILKLLGVQLMHIKPCFAGSWWILCVGMDFAGLCIMQLFQITTKLISGVWSYNILVAWLHLFFFFFQPGWF